MINDEIAWKNHSYYSLTLYDMSKMNCRVISSLWKKYAKSHVYYVWIILDTFLIFLFLSLGRFHSLVGILKNKFKINPIDGGTIFALDKQSWLDTLHTMRIGILLLIKWSFNYIYSIIITFFLCYSCLNFQYICSTCSRNQFILKDIHRFFFFFWKFDVILIIK